jgi:glycolate oxidase iron-sulfur subunit
MQTRFSDAQLHDPQVRMADGILRSCIHCGFCTATCPTYVLLGDELDSPRGRIYLIKNMLEGARPPTTPEVTHLDRCLSCLSCVSTCPSGVDYMHLMDFARSRIEATYTRPRREHWLRTLLTALLPYPARVRLILRLAIALIRLSPWVPRRLEAFTRLMPASLPKRSSFDDPQVFVPVGTPVRRVALLTGCVQQVIAPQINEATVRLLTRQGCEVHVVSGAGCCGALAQHLGKTQRAVRFAKANIDAWWAVLEHRNLDAIVTNASGCGTTLKDYGHLLQGTPSYADRASRIAGLVRDLSELLWEIGLDRTRLTPTRLRVAYQSPCSLHHGQRVRVAPKDLLTAAEFKVCTPADEHLCCGSAGTYNLLQPAIADELRARKLATLYATGADCVATANVGCLMQLSRDSALPVMHIAELLDWATGGARPYALRQKVSLAR